MTLSQTALSQTIKHWQFKTTENDPLVRQMAALFTRAGADEDEIASTCGLLFNEIEEAFIRGQHSI
jgi:hypothetical protein